MNPKNLKLLLITIVLAVTCTNVTAQATGSNNTLSSTGITAIQATTNSNYKLVVGGAVKLFNTDNSGLSSPSLYLINTSASGKKYFLNSDDAGSFRILDSAFATPRFTIYNSGNLGIGTSADAGFKLDVTGAARFSADAIINSVSIGRGTGTNNTTNTAIGISVLGNNTSGYHNTALGYHAMYSNTEGYGNVAIGSEAMYSSTGAGVTGYQNTAVGQQSLYSNTTGYNNTAIGIQSMSYNTTGIYNTAVGSSALRGNTTGAHNTAIGMNCLLYNTTGYRNSAVGYMALNSNTTGYANTAMGWQALYANTGSGNTSMGSDAMTYNTSGINNTALGNAAMYTSSTGSGNTSIGYGSLYAVAGDNNSALGLQAGFEVTSGAQNTLLGWNTGRGITTGNYNTILGANVTGLSAALSNNIILADGQGNRRINVDASGNVGINNTSPAEKLDVTGNIKLSGALMPAGAPGTSGQVLTSAGAGNAPTWTTPSGSGSGYWTANGNDISNNNSGNVGIGTTAAPSAKLHVVGDALITGNISSPGSGLGSEKFGSYATVNANNYSLALGYNANTTGHESVAIGSSARAAVRSTSIGNAAQATGYASTIVGSNGSDNGVNYITSIGASISNPGYFSGGSYLNSGMINIGYNNTSAGNNYTWLIGANLTTDRANQMLIGNGLAGGFLTDMVLGGGLSNSLAAAYGGVTIRTTDGSGANSSGMPLVFKGGKSTGSASGGDLSFFTTPAGTAGSSVNAEQERMRISGSGYIGIGTAAPSAVLHIKSQGGTNSGVLVESSNSALYAATELKNDAGDLTQLGLTGSSFSSGIFGPKTTTLNTNANGGINLVAYNATGVIKFATGGLSASNERMRIDASGNVGIGTTNTTDVNYKLFVETGIRTRKIKVDIASWPDYVFKSSYKLPSLKDLEAFLLKNNHLPDMPSAAEVEKSGIDLGDNQALLLKKVEELTLYMIELNKKVEALSKENEQLKKKVNATNQ